MGEKSFWNVPNEITFLRLIIFFLIVPLVLSQNYELKFLGLLVFVISSMLDWYDGYIARKLNMRTPFGSWFDVIVDRISEILFFFLFFFIGMVPLIIPIIFLVRGITTDSITYLSIKKFGYEKTYRKIFRSKFGKIKISSTVFDIYGVSKALIMLFIFIVYVWKLQLNSLVLILAWFITLFNIARGILVIYDSRKVI